MKTWKPVTIENYEAAHVLACVNKFVTMDGKLRYCGDTDKAIGVLASKAKFTGDTVSVVTAGIAIVECGGSVKADDYLRSDQFGRAATLCNPDTDEPYNINDASGEATWGLKQLASGIAVDDGRVGDDIRVKLIGDA